MLKYLILGFSLISNSVFAGNCGLASFDATPIQIASTSNIVSSGLGLTSVTTNSATLSTLDRQTAPYYVGATLNAFGYGSRIITAYSNGVATLSGSWISTPTVGAGYRIELTNKPVGASWAINLVPWSSPYGNSSGFALAIQWDRSTAQDCSDMVTIAKFGPGQGTGQNGDDGDIQFFANVLGVTSINNLRTPPRPEDWNPGVGGPRNGTNSSPLDVGPQFVGFRAINNPSAGSHLTTWQTDGIDNNGNGIIYHFMQTRVHQAQGGWAKFYNWPGGSPYPLVGGGNNGGWYFEDGYLWDAGAGTFHTRGIGVNGQWLNVP